VTWTPTLCQEFNVAQGQPDTSAWAFDLGDNNGWGNHEVEIYCGPPGYPNNPSQCPTPFNTATANAFVDGNGHLVIQVIHNGSNWYSARLKTEGTQNFLYGRIEASIKIPNTLNPGLWPTFWWLGSSYPTVPWPNCGEADIMENSSPPVLNGPGPAHDRSTVHTAFTAGSGITATYNSPSGQRADAAFYAYGVIWPDTMLIDYARQYTPSAVPAPVLGNPPPITVTAGATTGNTSTFTPSPAARSGYVYFSCATTAPKASCSIKTDDPLNQFVVNSDTDSPENVAVTVMTTSNALRGPNFLNRRIWRPFLLLSLFVMIIAVIVYVQHRRIGGSLRYIIASGLVLAATVIISCGSGRSSSRGGVGGGTSNIGTTPGDYTVTIYAFTEANSSGGRNSNADASVALPLTVN
jgi:hypothetical protein